MAAEETKALILGGGPSGLSVAAVLGADAIVLEKEDRVGGLCRSLHRRGATFDIGGHSFHTPYPQVESLVESALPGGLFRQTREARVHACGGLIPYPFQKHFDQLPDEDLVRECREGLERAQGDPAAADNFEQYIYRKFGAGIAQHFMLPYNRKLWARDISAVSCEWTSERVAGAKGESETFASTGGKRKPLQSDTRVGYPAAGGFEEIYRAIAAKADVRTKSEVSRVDPGTRLAHTADGRSFAWEALVSTAPLPELLRIIDDAPRELIELADTLAYMSLRVELLVADGPPRSPAQRVYVHEPEIPPHKIAFNHNSSDSLRARPVQAIMAEVSISEDKPVQFDQIAPRTIGLLCDLKLLGSPTDVIDVDHLNVKYGYPVYTKDRPEKVRVIKRWLETQGIFSCGRFGDWEYINSDRCIWKGLELGKRLREELQPGRGGHIG